MSSYIPGLMGSPNGAMASSNAHQAQANTDATLLSVQQLLDQVQNSSNHQTPAPQHVQQETLTPEQPPTPSLLHPPPAQIKQELGGTLAVPEAAEVDVPQCVIFGGETGEDEFLIPGRCLQKLPPQVLANLLQDGERMGSFHRLGSIPYWESMVRLNQYLDHGDYKPFKPAVPVEYLDAGGTAHVWNNRDSPIAVEIPRATFDLFMREIDLYLFAAKLGYMELRRTSAERLCSRYPKSTESILAMVQRVGEAANANDDQGLKSKIASYVNTNCCELTAMPAYLAMLRKLTKSKPPMGPVLLEAYFSSSEALRREAALKPAAAPKAANGHPRGSFSEASPMTMTPASGVNMVGSTGPPSYASSPPSRAPHPHPRFNTPLPASEIPNLVEALQRQCLVIANDNGYGTLVRDGARNVRNTDFKFLKAELLVADRFADTVNGRHNILVMNSRGETGDILRTLVKKVPAGLGVLAAGRFSHSDLLEPVFFFAFYLLTFRFTRPRYQ